jgi:hypothetical protein
VEITIEEVDLISVDPKEWNRVIHMFLQEQVYDVIKVED